jgi:NitT/TauT family transport system substrate-binding protein
MLVDERDLWPNGDFVTAQIIVSADYLEAHRDIVRAWIDAHVAVTQWMLANPAEAKQVVNVEVAKQSGKPLSSEALDAAWSRMKPTWDPIAPSLSASADAAYKAGFLREKPDLSGIYDLGPLNDVLRAHNLAEITTH